MGTAEVLPEPVTRVKVCFRCPEQHRDWFKSVAAHQGEDFESWLYTLAMREAIKSPVPEPVRRTD